MRGAWIALFATLLASPAEAVPRRAPGVVRPAPRRALRPAPRRAMPRRAPPPPARPVLDLQVAGLSTEGERRFPAVLHAIRRDAVPALTACVARFPGARGVAAVTLTPTTRGRQIPTVASNLPEDFARCAEEAVARVALPPREVIDDAPTAEPTPDAPVRFELRVRLPAVGAR